MSINMLMCLYQGQRTLQPGIGYDMLVVVICALSLIISIYTVTSSQKIHNHGEILHQIFTLYIEDGKLSYVRVSHNKGHDYHYLLVRVHLRPCLRGRAGRLENVQG